MPGKLNQAAGSSSKRHTEVPQGTTHTTSQVSLFYRKLEKVKTTRPEVEWIDVLGNDDGRAVHQAVVWLDKKHNATSSSGHATFAAAKENVASAAIQLLETNYQF
jgi:hypothetical protein